jgi:hypothetical protein
VVPLVLPTASVVAVAHTSPTGIVDVASVIMKGPVTVVLAESTIA